MIETTEHLIKDFVDKIFDIVLILHLDHVENLENGVLECLEVFVLKKGLHGTVIDDGIVEVLRKQLQY